jgi:hypothetical protein
MCLASANRREQSDSSTIAKTDGTIMDHPPVHNREVNGIFRYLQLLEQVNQQRFRGKLSNHQVSRTRTGQVAGKRRVQPDLQPHVCHLFGRKYHL